MHELTFRFGVERMSDQIIIVYIANIHLVYVGLAQACPSEIE